MKFITIGRYVINRDAICLIDTQRDEVWFSTPFIEHGSHLRITKEAMQTLLDAIADIKQHKKAGSDRAIDEQTRRGK